MRLFHASDLHLTWRNTSHELLDAEFFGWFGERHEGEWHTRLSTEALVLHCRRLLDAGRTDWHLVLTGDITDMGSREEMALAREVLAPIWDPRFLTVVPGNHDCPSEALAHAARRVYGMDVPSDFEERRRLFRRTFGELMQSSPGYEGYRWPFVKLLPHARLALVGLDSTDAANLGPGGRLHDWQLELLDEVLGRLETERRTRDFGVALALHHSPLPDYIRTRAGGAWDGLEDWEALLEVCEGRVTCILNGHHHVAKTAWDGTAEDVPVLQAPSPAISVSEVPGVDVDEVALCVYRLRDGDLRSLDDVEETSVPLAPALRERQRAFREGFAGDFRPPVACGACEGPVCPEMDHCPWCGEEPDFAGLFPNACGECTRPVMPGFECCPWCGTEFEEASGRYDSGERMTLACGECGSGVEPYHLYCACCGEEQEPATSDDAEACDTCDWPVSGECLFCPFCGDTQ